MLDSRGRDTRIHGLVLDEGNPAPTLRELCRQWVEYYESDRSHGRDLAERTRMVLGYIGPDGTPEPALPTPDRGSEASE